MAEETLPKINLTTDAIPKRCRSHEMYSDVSDSDDDLPKGNVFTGRNKEWVPKQQTRTKNLNAYGNLTYIKNSKNIHIGNTFTVHGAGKTNKPSSFNRDTPVKPSKNVQRAFSSITQIEKMHILHIKGLVGNGWQDLGRYLGYNDAFLEQMKTKSQSDVVYKLLLDWIQLNERGATLGILCKSLYDSHEVQAAENLSQFTF